MAFFHLVVVAQMLLLLAKNKNETAIKRLKASGRRQLLNPHTRRTINLFHVATVYQGKHVGKAGGGKEGEVENTDSN